MRQVRCRSCESTNLHTFCDLGGSPLSNSYVAAEALQKAEIFYPLHTYVCGECFLVQLEEFETPAGIFSDYAYFSSYSDSWLRHVEAYAKDSIQRFGLNAESHVVEIASNDGYLLQYFIQQNIPVLGIEPAANVARVAQDKGIDTLVEFFSTGLASKLVAEGKQADLIVGKNVLAHVPELNDFVKGLKLLLKPAGVVTMEFPHLERLMQENQFDTIYHEHFSYFSLLAIEPVFNRHGLEIFDVVEAPTHGGSIRIYAHHVEDKKNAVTPAVKNLRDREHAIGLNKLETYSAFARQVVETKFKVLDFLIKAKQSGKTIAGYGAPAKGNTLLNYCGVRGEFIEYTVDRSPHKQGKFLPGTHIPIYAPEHIAVTKPDYLVILPWNIKEEVMQQMSAIREWGGQFIVFIPEPHVVK